MDNVQLGIIGGSGLYGMPGLQETQQLDLLTPYGKPSAPVVVACWRGKGGLPGAAWPGAYHLARGDQLPRQHLRPEKPGVERIVSISAVGSLREDYAPGDIVVPDQLLDHTRERKASFFEGALWRTWV